MATELPLDVHFLIIEWVFRSSQHTDIDYITLHACALVCRAWTPTAQRLLFRRIYCTSVEDKDCDIQGLIRTLSTSPHLVALIRYIQVAWPSCPPDYGNACLRLLELCPHVEGISFLGWSYNNRPLSPEMDARMRAIQLKPAFINVAGLDDTIGTAILKMWPRVRTLILDGRYTCPLPPTVESAEIFAALGEYRWFSKPLPVLRDLCLTWPKWTDKALCQHVLSADFLPRLQSLHLNTEFPPQDILDLLIQLRSLVVGQLPWKPVVLPQSLHHVGYHPGGASVSAVSAELAVYPLRALPELQLVTAMRFVEQQVWAALEGMCCERRIGFETYASFHSFQEPRYADWI
ncbi:hypothetical protein FA95DRAFT_1602178 [Auriscalpium vulgare]|uniref:Uncharacterized protein n=1 Tax=Auriscalpium vulgare TaxID=40419 RepID=A0ACB8S724_9AGAM|nr:hypothetical protein FA95DRAFT_1602178 [Auriscalpium vulgare]